MPAYEYACESCGGFTGFKPLAEYQAPQPCPDCGAPSPRAWITAPAVSGLASASRQAHLRNERSADSPRSSADPGGRHGSACSCCHAKLVAQAVPGKPSIKGFAARRPWMISH